MANPNPFYFCQTLNGGGTNNVLLIGNAPSSSDGASQNMENIQRLQRYTDYLQREQQQNFALFVQLEQEKRTILAWNLHLERENAALKAEIMQLKQQKNANATRENGQQTENRSEGAKERPSVKMSSREIIDALIGDGKNDNRLTTDANGIANPPHLAIGISSAQKRPLSAANRVGSAKSAERVSDESRDFGKQIEQIVSTILDNHSPYKMRRQLVPGAQGAKELRHIDQNRPAAPRTNDDIECIGIKALRDSFSDDEIEIEFPPPPKTPPPPITPPLSPSTNRPSVSAQMFETSLQTIATTDERIVSDAQLQQPPPTANNSVPTVTDNAHIPQNDGAAVKGGGGGQHDGEEVIFVDDVCRNKWVPSMAKKEPTTEWEEIVLDGEEKEQRERTDEAAAPTDGNTAQISSMRIEQSQKANNKTEIE